MPTTRSAIGKLHDAGLTPPQIAQRLDLAPATVRYHLERLRANTDTASAGARSAVRALTETARFAPSGSRTRDRVAQLLEVGFSRAEIARRLGVSKPTVSYHCRRLDRPVDERCARRYDWEAVQRYHDEGHSVRECIAMFGFSSASWHEAVKRGAITARPSALPIKELLVDATYRGRFHLKARLLKEGLKENRCERCGVREWLNSPLTLALHHVNGRRNDNRLENLQLLCPNCHSQTDNYAGRNGRSASRQAA